MFSFPTEIFQNLNLRYDFFSMRRWGHSCETWCQQKEEKDYPRITENRHKSEFKQLLLIVLVCFKRSTYLFSSVKLQTEQCKILQPCQIQCILRGGCYWPKWLQRWRWSLWAPLCSIMASGHKYVLHTNSNVKAYTSFSLIQYVFQRMVTTTVLLWERFQFWHGNQPSTHFLGPPGSIQPPPWRGWGRGQEPLAGCSSQPRPARF